MRLQPEAVLELIRAMRHSGLNHLQVIAGWLQLGQADRAREYVAQVSERLTAEAALARLQPADFALALLLAAARAELHGVDLRWGLELPAGRSPVPAAAALVFDLLQAAMGELAASPCDAAPALTVTLQAAPDGSLNLRLQASQPLALPGMTARAEALGARLTGSGGDLLLTQISAV